MNTPATGPTALQKHLQNPEALRAMREMLFRNHGIRMDVPFPIQSCGPSGSLSIRCHDGAWFVNDIMQVGDEGEAIENEADIVIPDELLPLRWTLPGVPLEPVSHPDN